MGEIRRVLLLAPARMPQAVEWRRFLEAAAGECLLASFHDGDVASIDEAKVIHLQRGETPSLSELPSIWGKTRSLLRSRAYDLVIAYYLTSYGLLAASLAPGRYVAAAAGSDIDPLEFRAVRRVAARIALRRSIGAIAWTEPMADRMRQLGANPSRLLVLPRGIDLEQFHAVAPHATADGTPHIVSTRRLRPIFRHDRVVQAMARLSAAGVPGRLELIGDGSERPRLETLVRELGLGERVSLSGGVSRPQIGERLRQADIFVSLSSSDGLSTSLVEAVACGFFPVVSDIPSNRQVVEHGQNGLLVDGDDVEGIASALTRAVQDRDLRERARAANAKIVRERFDIRRNTRTFLETAAGWSDPKLEGARPAHAPTGGAR